MKLEGLDTTVEIKLSNGVYQFDCESATGKHDFMILLNHTNVMVIT